MKNERFEQIVANTQERLEDLMKLKGGEYASEADRLSNFKKNAEALGLDPMQVWAVYAGKHWDAVQTYIRDLASGVERPRLESIQGRADDLIVYLHLFHGLLEDSEQK